MFLMTHFYPGGTAEQYARVLAAVHPDGALPPGQVSSAAGPTDGGWLIAAIWESPGALEQFVEERLMPALSTLEGGFETPPEERTSELTLYQVAE
jgi:hypothetical protein